MPRGLKDQRDGCSFFKGKILRIWQAIHFGCANEFGAAAVDHVTEVSELAATIVEAGQARGAFAAGDAGGEDHSLADAYGGDLGADLDNFACDVAPWNMWERDRNAGDALAYPEIETIKSASADAHENFIGAYRRVGSVHIYQDFGAAVLLELIAFIFGRLVFLCRADRSEPCRQETHPRARASSHTTCRGLVSDKR